MQKMRSYSYKLFLLGVFCSKDNVTSKEQKSTGKAVLFFAYFKRFKHLYQIKAANYTGAEIS